MSTTNADQQAPASPQTPPSVVFNDISDNQSGRPAENKVDVSQALKLYLEKGLSKADIARFFNVTPQSITYHLQPFDHLLAGGNNLAAYRENRVNIKDNVELILLTDLADPVKRAGASLNNVAYAYRQIHETRRLDEGLSTSNVDLHAEFESLKQLRDAKQILQNACSQTTQNDYHE